MARNLTYLGNPYEEGKGTAAIIDGGNTDMVFINQMQRFQEEKKKRDLALLEKQKAQQQAIDNWDVNNWLNHQGYFQDKAKAVKQQGIDLLAYGFDLNDMTKPQVADWYKKMAEIEQDAKISEAFGKMGDMYKEMKPADRDKYTPQSWDAVHNFYFGDGVNGMPDFEKQMQVVKDGIEPKLQLKVDKPYKDVLEDIKVYNAKIPTFVAGLDTVEAEKKWQDVTDQYIAGLSDRMGDPNNMFWEADNPQNAKDEYLLSVKDLFKKSLKDWEAEQKIELGKGELAEKVRSNKADEYLKQQKANLDKAKFAYEKAQQQTQTLNYDKFVEDAVEQKDGEVVFGNRGDLYNIYDENGDLLVKRKAFKETAKDGSQVMVIMAYDENDKPIKNSPFTKGYVVKDGKTGKTNQQAIKDFSSEGFLNYSMNIESGMYPYEAEVKAGGKTYGVTDYGQSINPNIPTTKPKQTTKPPDLTKFLK